MSTIKTQAIKLQRALNACTRGAAVSFRITRTERMDGFYIYAAYLNANVMDNGAPLCTIDDLSIDNVPYILAQLHSMTGISIYMTVFINAKRGAKRNYCMATKFCSRVIRISEALYTALHESAIRDDEITVDSSVRTSEVSYGEYSEQWTFRTLAA